MKDPKAFCDTLKRKIQAQIERRLVQSIIILVVDIQEMKMVPLLQTQGSMLRRHLSHMKKLSERNQRNPRHL